MMSGIVLPCPTTRALPFSWRNFETSAPISFPATIVGAMPVDLDVGAAVCWVRLNSLIKIVVMPASFRLRASASARKWPVEDYYDYFGSLFAFSEYLYCTIQ